MFQGQVQNGAKSESRIIRTYQPGAVSNRFNKLCRLYALFCLPSEVLPVAWPFGSNCVNKDSAHSLTTGLVGAGQDK
jgi:hypothetical protein